MGIIKLFQSGFWDILFDKSLSAPCIISWLSLVAGIIVQTICLKVKSKNTRIEIKYYPAFVVAGILICFELVGRFLNNTDVSALMVVYGYVICFLAGIAIPAAIYWVRKILGK